MLKNIAIGFGILLLIFTSFIAVRSKLELHEMSQKLDLLEISVAAKLHTRLLSEDELLRYQLQLRGVPPSDVTTPLSE